MKIKSRFVLLLLSLILLSVQSVVAHEKVTVVPLFSKQNAFKGDLYHTIPFAQFEAAQETTDYEHGWFFASLGYLITEGGSLGVFNAPVSLPHNAVISELSLGATDDSNSGNITVWLEKVPIDAVGPLFIPDQTGVKSDTIATDTTGVVSIAIPDEVVDNENYYYFVYALFQSSPSDHLKAVRIKYTLP